jgi:hypothetical protein
MCHYGNAGRGSRKQTADNVRKARQVRSKLEALTVK